MTSKERVHKALKRETVDRVPIFMWFHPGTTKKLAEALGIPPEFVDIVLGNDVKQIWVGNNYAMEGIVHEHDGESHVDLWGIKWVKDGAFNQITYSPLSAVSAEECLNYRFPYEQIPELIKTLDPLMKYKDSFFIGCDVSPCIFELYYRIRGMEDALSDLAAEPEFAAKMLRNCGDFSIALSKAALNKYPVDWLWTGDDVGSQQALMMSPAAWRELIKPNLKRIFEVGKAKKLWIAYHSCGAISPIISDLIEIGLDVLNPIQCNCQGMDPFELKKEFGRELAFMGGVDTQGVLPNGTPQEVRIATERLLEGMTADGGGYILAASHTIPPETPLDNIFAMYEAAGLSKEQIFDEAAKLRRKK